MRRESTFWLVALLAVVMVAAGSIYVRMDIPEAEDHHKAKGTAPAGIEISRTGGPLGPIQYDPVDVVVVNLADHIIDSGDLPTGTGDASNRPESPISERLADRLRRRAMRKTFTPNVDAGNNVPPMLDPPGVEITAYQDGADAEDNPGFLVPPDPEIAASHDYLIAVVNVVFTIHDKVGGPATLVDAASFFSADPRCPGSVFDPDVVYDEESDRFVLGYDASGTHYCVAFSQSADPFGAWNLYAFPTATGSQFFDYPHIGVGKECIGMGSNIFDPGFVGSNVWCMKKFDGYNGNPLTVVMGTTGFSSTPQFANLHGSDLTAFGSEHYIVTDDLFDGQTFGVFVWDALGVGGDPVAVSTPSWTPGGGGFPIDTPQPGADTLAGNDWRIQAKPEQRNGSIWPTATVSANPSGTAVVNCFQWAEYDIDSDSIVQGGLTCPDTHTDFTRNAIFADGAVNECGDFMVGFTRSQATDEPGTAMCGRRGDTPLNSLRCGKGFKRGEAPYGAFDGAPLRWGDYSGMTPDPNGSDFWYFGEYSKALDNQTANWGTHIGRIVTDCALN